MGPVIGHQLVIEIVLLSHMGDVILEGRRQKVLNEPKLDPTIRVLDHTQDHDGQESLIQMT